MAKVSRLEVMSTGARRRWTIEEKLRIVAESYAAPGNVSATARRHGLSASQLFYWRQWARKRRFSSPDDGQPAFVPAVVTPDANHGASGQIEIVFAGSTRVIVGRDVDAAALRRVIEVLGDVFERL
jgi:transposase